MRKSLFFTYQILLFAIVTFAFANSAGAATLTEYRENIRHLKDDLDSVINPEQNLTDAENLSLEKAVLDEFPKLLPAKDQVEWQNSVVEINNQWIYDALERLKKEPPPSPKRRMILIEVRERLAALEDKLDELENQTAAINAAKDQDKRKLAEILRRAEYQKPKEKQESVIEKLYNRIISWIVRMLPRPNISPGATGGFQSLSFVLQMILYALILGAIGFIVYRFAPFLINKYRFKEKLEKKARVILGERLAADETARSLFDEAENLARAGNLRGAIRRGYIALLCELSDKKIIGLAQHKTNRDYLRDVRQQHELHENMSGLTVNYERHWYGLENAQEKDWEEFRNDYKKAVGSQ